MARPEGKKKQDDPPEKWADSLSKILDETAQFVKELRALKEKERTRAKGQKNFNEGKEDDEDKGDDRDSQSENDKKGDNSGSGSNFEDPTDEAAREILGMIPGIQKALRDAFGSPEEPRSTEAVRHAKHEPIIANARTDNLSESPQLSLANETNGQAYLPRNSEIDDAPDSSAGHTDERRRDDHNDEGVTDSSGVESDDDEARRKKRRRTFLS